MSNKIAIIIYFAAVHCEIYTRTKLFPYIPHHLTQISLQDIVDREYQLIGGP